MKKIVEESEKPMIKTNQKKSSRQRKSKLSLIKLTVSVNQILNYTLLFFQNNFLLKNKFVIALNMIKVKF